MSSTTRQRVLGWGSAFALIASVGVYAQTTNYLWAGLGNDAHHTAITLNPSQNLNKIFWTAPVDLQPQYSGNDLLIHYGSPISTKGNTILIPVKTGASDGFRIDARRGTDGFLKYSLDTDYRMPPHGWGVPMGVALTSDITLYTPGAGGTVIYRKNANGTTGETGRLVFYGAENYNSDPATYNNNIFINTPITVDNIGNIYFGFWATGDTPLHLKSGIVRMTKAGVATMVSAADAAGDTGISKVVTNCAPAFSNDYKTLYIAVHSGSWTGGYLLGLNRNTLETKYRVRLKDVNSPDNDALLIDDGTASPTVGPDGDVFYGVLENNLGSNHFRGWLLHYDATLTTQKLPGAFGWDDTASIVPNPGSPDAGPAYFIMSKYNNYASAGGDGVNKIAILDPTSSMVDPVSGAKVMKEVMTQAGPTPDEEFRPTYPNAVREWCINSAAVDPKKMCVYANSEDGKLYRWNLLTNTLDQTITLTAGIGEAYTPTMVGADGRVYAINNGTLFSVGEK